MTEAQRGTGQIICNVQRYNPTPAQLQDSVDGFPGDPTATPPLPPRPPVLAPSVQGDYTRGGPTEASCRFRGRSRRTRSLTAFQ